MDTLSQDISPLDQAVITQEDLQEQCVEPEPTPELIDYECQRYPLWDIHRFIEQVLATDKPGFQIITDKHGRTTIRQLPLAWHYGQIRSYVQRIPSDSKPTPLIALFQECCAEMGLITSVTQAGDFNGLGICQAERYNTFLNLIRTKAATVQKYLEAKKFVFKYDRRMFERLQKYIDTLFLIYSKLLVVRLDLEYREEHADYVTLEQARRDISRFISHRRWSRLFEHCVGFIIAREHGNNGCGFHFHCILFFNGQKRHQDVNLAKAIGKDYWEGYITRLACEGETWDTRGRYFNCNAKHDDYKYLGIGMISHWDEVKRSNLFYSLIYLTKWDQGLEGIAPPKTRTITRGVLPCMPETKRGAPRKIIIRGKRLPVPRKT